MKWSTELSLRVFSFPELFLFMICHKASWSLAATVMVALETVATMMMSLYQRSHLTAKCFRCQCLCLLCVLLLCLQEWPSGGVAKRYRNLTPQNILTSFQVRKQHSDIINDIIGSTICNIIGDMITAQMRENLQTSQYCVYAMSSPHLTCPNNGVSLWCFGSESSKISLLSFSFRMHMDSSPCISSPSFRLPLSPLPLSLTQPDLSLSAIPHLSCSC